MLLFSTGFDLRYNWSVFLLLNLCHNHDKISKLKLASCNLQHATSNLELTYVAAAIKVARKWAAPRP